MIRKLGMPQIVLMERAALAVYDEIKKADRVRTGGSVLVASGPGNNGADGAAAGRLLSCGGMNVTVLVCGNKDKFTDALIKQIEIAHNYGCTIVYDSDAAAETLSHDYDVIIDAILGVGMSRPLTGRFAQITDSINNMTGYKVAVDMPTGVDPDDGSVSEKAFRADKTVTFSYEKPGQYLYPGTLFCGNIVCRQIGIDSCYLADIEPELTILEGMGDFKEEKRDPSGNKGSFGKLLIIAGHKNVCGAAILACRSAYRSGCGMVRIYTAESNRVIIQETVPEAVLCTYPDDNYTGDGESAQELEKCINWSDRILIGPGLGTGDEAEQLVRRIAGITDIPLVFDADALNIIAESIDIRTVITVNQNEHIIFTPHMGELARLLDISITELKKDWIHNVHSLADELGVIVVSKDARTVIVSPHRKAAYINVMGNSGMATAGAGDVLAGITGALISNRTDAAQSAAESVVMHAAAGDRAAAYMGERAVMAGDIIAYL